MSAKIQKKKKRRTAIKKLTKEATILRFMRESRGFSMRKAAHAIGVSAAQINHAENGRRDLDTEFILKAISIYGYGYQEFLSYLDGKVQIPASLMTECIAILKRISPDKLITVKTILQTF